MKKAARTRLGVATRTAADWEDAALELIATGGIAAVSIPELARTLGVTKGSFYWHFSSLDELITRAVKRWEENDKVTLDQVRSVKESGARLRALFAEAMVEERAQRLFLALSLSSNRRVAASLRRVSERRLALLVECYREFGMTGADARLQALLTYSVYIGALHIRSSDVPWLQKPSDVRNYVNHAGRVLIDALTN